MLLIRKVDFMRNLILQVKDLKVYFDTDEGLIKAVDGVSFNVEKNSVVAIVGESGCGKSVTARSILQLLPMNAHIVDGELNFNLGDDKIIEIHKLDRNSREMRAIRGGEISIVFQDPMTFLNPVYTIGYQIYENIKEHLHYKYLNSIAKIHEILASVGISNPIQRSQQFPHELSGGMRQRSMIGMSLSANPKLIIADEPTTALDVTIQAQVLDLMKKIQNEKGMSVILITHDMGVVAEMADFVVVMYMGKIVEKASCQMIFNNPKHPYTIKLLESIPKLGRGRNQKLKPISGTTPNFTSLPTGCLFSPRCDFASSKCSNIPKEIEYSDNHFVSCWKYNEEIKEN